MTNDLIVTGDGLPEWQPEAEEVVEETDDFTALVRSWIASAPQDDAGRLLQAHQIQQFAEYMWRQTNRIKHLLAEMALAVHQHQIWRNLPGCESEAEFWKLAGWADYREISRLIDFQTHVVPLLNEVNIPTEDLAEIGSEKIAALAKVAKAKRQERIRTNKPMSDEERAQVRTDLESLLALSDTDVHAYMRDQAGKSPKVPLHIKVTPHLDGQGEPYVSITYRLDLTTSLARDSHHTYEQYSYLGQSIRSEDISRILSDAHSGDLSGFQQVEGTVTELEDDLLDVDLEPDLDPVF